MPTRIIINHAKFGLMFKYLLEILYDVLDGANLIITDIGLFCCGDGWINTLKNCSPSCKLTLTNGAALA